MHTNEISHASTAPSNRYDFIYTREHDAAAEGVPRNHPCHCCWGQVPFNYEMNRRRGTAQSLLFGLIIADRRWAGDNLGRRGGSRNFERERKSSLVCVEVIMK